MTHFELLIDGMFVGGPCDQSIGKQVVRAPYDLEFVGTAAEGGLGELRACVEAAHHAFQTWRKSPRHERQALLRRIASLVRERQDELVELLTREVGKPITWSRAEVTRLAITFEDAADLLATFGHTALPVDLDPRGVGHRATVERFPRGVIFCIVPYNWPFNLAAHKIAPALATGNTVVLKVSPLAPLSTLALARLIHEAGCPAGVVNAWNGPAPVAQKVLTEDKRIRMLSFTGSGAVGWKLKSLLPDRMVTLELGGDAFSIVHDDADLDWAVTRNVTGAFGYAGQICISVQHILVHASLYPAFLDRFVEATRKCPTGAPMDPATICGPLISDEAANRVVNLIAGHEIAVGGRRTGRVVEPTILVNVPADSRLFQEEAFGPVVTVSPYEELGEAVATVNRSPFGIQAGLFTHDLRVMEQAYREIETGGLIVGDTPSLRFDNLPYGGVKQSGFGREGVAEAMTEMTEPKALVIRTTQTP